jgi:hypothetical protein
MIRFLTPVPALYRGFLLHPDHDRDPYVFRIEVPSFGVGTVRLVFSSEPRIGTNAIHVEWGPLSFHKRTTPRSWLTGGRKP